MKTISEQVRELARQRAQALKEVGRLKAIQVGDPAVEAEICRLETAIKEREVIIARYTKHVPY